MVYQSIPASIIQDKKHLIFFFISTISFSLTEKEETLNTWIDTMAPNYV